MSGINGNGGNFGWLKFWAKKSKTYIGNEDNLDKPVDMAAKTRIKPSSTQDNNPSSTLRNGKVNSLPPEHSDSVSLCALPIISPSYSTDETERNTEEASLSSFSSTISEPKAPINSPFLQEVNEIIISYKDPTIPLRDGETLQDALARTPKTSPHFSTLKELVKIQKMLHESKGEIEEELCQFKHEFQDVREESSIIKDIIFENRSDRLFNDLQSNLNSRSSTEKNALLEKRQNLISTCSSLKEEAPQNIKWLESKIEEVTGEGNTAFNTVYLEFLKIQKSSLDKQPAMLNSIIRSLENGTRAPISKGRLWNELQKTLRALPQMQKVLACRVMYNFNGDSSVKDVCKALLTSKEPIARPDDVSTASLLTLIKDIRAGGYLKYEIEQA